MKNIILLFVLYITSMSIVESATCKDHLRSLVLESRRSTFLRKKALYLNKSDIKAIKELWNNKDKDVQEKLEKSYSIYQDARLRDYTKAEKKEYLEYMNDIKLTDYKFNNKEIKANAYEISYPSEIKDSALLFGILAHETEHRIQTTHYFKVDGFEKLHIAKFLADIFFFVKTKFELEKGAMSAEWEFLHHLPKGAINDSLAILEKSDMDKKYKNVFNGMLLNSRYSKNEYLRRQHSNGRYSLEEISKARIAPSALALLSAFTFFVAIDKLIEE